MAKVQNILPRKTEICKTLQKDGKCFITEAIFETGGRADILVLDDFKVIEIAKSKTQDSLGDTNMIPNNENKKIMRNFSYQGYKNGICPECNKDTKILFMKINHNVVSGCKDCLIKKYRVTII